MPYLQANFISIHSVIDNMFLYSLITIPSILNNLLYNTTFSNKNIKSQDNRHHRNKPTIRIVLENNINSILLNAMINKKEEKKYLYFIKTRLLKLSKHEPEYKSNFRLRKL